MPRSLQEELAAVARDPRREAYQVVVCVGQVVLVRDVCREHGQVGTQRRLVYGGHVEQAANLVAPRGFPSVQRQDAGRNVGRERDVSLGKAIRSAMGWFFPKERSCLPPHRGSSISITDIDSGDLGQVLWTR